MYPIDILPISPENIIALFLKFRNRKIINEIINEIIKISGTRLYDLLINNKLDKVTSEYAPFKPLIPSIKL